MSEVLRLKPGTRNLELGTGLITLGDQAYPAARCPICPGNMMIFPPEALEAHMARHNGTFFKRWCRRCKNDFFIDTPERVGFAANYCPPCRSMLTKKGKATPTRVGGRMSSTGMEKKDNVRAV
jgi:hypothetical protein